MPNIRFQYNDGEAYPLTDKDLKDLCGYERYSTNIEGDGDIIFRDDKDVPELTFKGEKIRFDNLSYVSGLNGGMSFNGENLAAFAKKLRDRNQPKRSLSNRVMRLIKLFKPKVRQESA